MSRLDIADTALSLVTDLTSHIVELETRLASQTPIIDDELYIHRQLDELNEIDQHLQSVEKSIKELLIQSQQLCNERLIRISEQLASRWQQINAEIHQRLFFRMSHSHIFFIFIFLFPENEHFYNV